MQVMLTVFVIVYNIVPILLVLNFLAISMKETFRSIIVNYIKEFFFNQLGNFFRLNFKST